MAAAIYNYPYTSGHTDPANAGDICVGLGSCRPDTDHSRVVRTALVTNINVIVTGGILPGQIAHCDVGVAVGVAVAVGVRVGVGVGVPGGIVSQNLPTKPPRST